MKRVFLLLRNSLFGNGVAELVRYSSEIEIVGQATDLETAKESILALQPDAVIVDEALCHDLLAAYLDILKTEVSLRIVGLNLNNNTVHVYQKEQWQVHKVEDLTAVICHV